MPEEIKRTSLDLPLSLWARAKAQAIHERTDFRSIVVKALERHLPNTVVLVPTSLKPIGTKATKGLGPKPKKRLKE
jgi:hypothetical protein